MHKNKKKIESTYNNVSKCGGGKTVVSSVIHSWQYKTRETLSAELRLAVVNILQKNFWIHILYKFANTVVKFSMFIQVWQVEHKGLLL